MEKREIDLPTLLERVRTAHTLMHTSVALNTSSAATF